MFIVVDTDVWLSMEDTRQAESGLMT